ncbi:MAG TPA: DUF3108 domain-containing protein [Candidatus Cybelea sp.]|nr:DUF3108 domain-containing protein [Candidatus Cybelea sp.]
MTASAVRAAAVAAALAVAWTSGASCEPATYRFAATWAGLPAADIYLTLDDGERSYKASIDIRSVGMVKLLSKFAAHAESAGSFLDGIRAKPNAYDADYKLRKKRNHVALQFAAAADRWLVTRGPADTSNKPLPPAEMRRDTIDPLAALMAVRTWARQGPEVRGKPFHIPVFDGKRRFDVDGKLVGIETVQIGGAAVRAMHVSVVLLPIAGFKTAAEEGEDIETDPRPLDLILSDDERLVPLKISVSAFLLPAETQIIATCTTPCPAPPF